MMLTAGSAPLQACNITFIRYFYGPYYSGTLNRVSTTSRKIGRLTTAGSGGNTAWGG
jgi:hypothetical protein